MEKELRISYSTLQSLSGGLCSSMVTVIAEIVANAWDANAKKVTISIEKGKIIIIDDGHGMNKEEFIEKFLNVGFSRREESDKSEGEKRFVMGRKGIGKLSTIALADRSFSFN